MPRSQVMGYDGFAIGYVDTEDVPPPAAGGQAQLMAHPMYADPLSGFTLPVNIQRACFIGFADRDYDTGEIFELNYEIVGAAEDVVFAECGLCTQSATPFQIGFAGDPVYLNVRAARDVSADVVATGQYRAVLPLATSPEPQIITQGQPLWIVWSVTCSTTQPTFMATPPDPAAPLNAEGNAVAWIPSNEIGAPASTFTVVAGVGDLPIRGIVRPSLAVTP